ncbi:hypothetical protein GUY44_17045 [Pimelobacter simplex]|uniref:Uncharacterized protein n=1 Tax=Nocardioides simplex TaxID=2045 RepID=A0A0A1DIC2_NOCSI|nr:DUF2231 domain-containing protein [Pimelobacter simplex]AIY17014.1 hypothetical protein KR76_10055 [Pimelobacter simplex]MCG8152199.1 hypothetical protein [Pimelobacter simplex]GEB12943.1 hypothetical protein NSI01_12580 [Pimelobacter simplex]
MEINGVPLHPLVVHAAVVLTPLAGLAAVGYAVPAWRDRLRWPLVVLAVVAAAAVWVAYLSGENLRTDRFAGVTGTLADRIADHETWAKRLRIGASVFAVLAVAAAWLHTRSGPVRSVLTLLVVAGGLVTLVLVVLTGDAGAQATWRID